MAGDGKRGLALLDDLSTVMLGLRPQCNVAYCLGRQIDRLLLPFVFFAVVMLGSGLEPLASYDADTGSRLSTERFVPNVFVTLEAAVFCEKAYVSTSAAILFRILWLCLLEVPPFACCVGVEMHRAMTLSSSCFAVIDAA